VSRFAGESYVLFVDYVQKVPAAAMSSAHMSENDRIGRVVAALKEVALEQRAAVVAVSAAGEQGLTARRLHLHHLRGAARLAYEADAVVLLNEKLDVVSPSHVAYSTLRLDELGRRVVFSVEKNRNGPSGVDVEFAKEFDSSRFDPQGAWVTEPLWHELGAEG
jgi:replicative DNA helicase